MNKLVLFLSVLFLLSFKSADNRKNIKQDYDYCLIKMEVNNTNEWGQWKESACYKGIEFHTRSTGEKTGDIQFRNRYTSHKVYFSYSIWKYQNSNVYYDLGGRTECEANGGLSSVTFFIAPENTTFWVKVEKLRFDSEGNEYEKCDK